MKWSTRRHRRNLVDSASDRLEPMLKALEQRLEARIIDVRKLIDANTVDAVATTDANLRRVLEVLLQMNDERAAVDDEMIQIARSLSWVGSFADRAHSIQQTVEQLRDFAAAQRDDRANRSRRLRHVRTTAEYEATFADHRPLVSVRIATFDRADVLFERTLPSVLNQTYRNIELVIVGDGCTDDTAARIAELNDNRIRFRNFSRRSRYPQDRYLRWMVAGSPAMNEAVRMARGRWIAPLDDDDEFELDHVERLLKEALASRAEMVYGAVRSLNLISGEAKRIWSAPPELGGFAFTGALVATPIAEIFEYDEDSWVYREPGDWNLCRRMLDAGVRWSAIDDTVGTLHMVPPNLKQDSG